MINEPRTHPVKPTLNSDEVTIEARTLWENLRDICSNEEAWYIIQKALDDYAVGVDISVVKEVIDAQIAIHDDRVDHVRLDLELGEEGRPSAGTGEDEEEG